MLDKETRLSNQESSGSKAFPEDKAGRVSGETNVSMVLAVPLTARHVME